MDRDTTVKILAGLRLAVGGSTWATPNVSGKMFGLDADSNPQGPYLARLFAVRDAALGAGLLRSKKKAQVTWLEIGVACDAADAVAALLGGAKGYLSPAASAMLTGAALSGLALGVTALRD